MIKTKFENRKDLVKAVGEYAKEKPKYMGAPTFAFEVGDFKIDKDGNITSETDLSELENFLIERGFAEREENIVTKTEETKGSEIININTHFSLDGIEEQAVIRFLNMLYSKQYLINKSVGFIVLDISSEFIQNAQNQKIGDIEFDGTTGISIEENQLVFQYPNAEDTEMLNAYLTLISKAFEKAKESKHCKAEYSTPENEKYYMRSWLIRLGLGGKEYSQIRKLLLKNLKGNASFKTDEEMETFKEKHRKGTGDAE